MSPSDSLKTQLILSEQHLCHELVCTYHPSSQSRLRMAMNFIPHSKSHYCEITYNIRKCNHTHDTRKEALGHGWMRENPPKQQKTMEQSPINILINIRMYIEVNPYWTQPSRHHSGSARLLLLRCTKVICISSLLLVRPRQTAKFIS